MTAVPTPRWLMLTVMALAQVGAAAPEKLTRVVDYEVSVAPDGQRVAFISNRNGPYDLYVMNADGKELRRLTDDLASEDNPAWSPDGRWIAFVSDKSGDNDLYVVAADGGEARRITSTAGADLHPAWSPDGRRLLFTSLRNSPSADRAQLDLFVIGVDGRGERQLTRGPNTSFASWSPDGQHIVYWQAVGDNAEIALADSEGRRLRFLTSNPAFDGWPSWSPDGRRIAFSRERGEEADIYVVDLAGNEQLAIGGEGRKVGPRWSADGRSIIYSHIAARESRIWRAPAPAERKP